MESLKRLKTVFSPKTWRLLLVTFGIFIVPMFLFVQLADEVRDRDTLAFDEAILHAVNGLSSPLLDGVVVAFTELGGVIGVAVLTIGSVLLLWKRHMYKRAVLLTVGVGGAALLNLLLKSFFQRDRPQLWERLVTENSYSFPSGHAMASCALAASMVVVFWHTKWRWLAVVIAALYMIGIAFTRLYLGVHYPTDILAGWIVSASWVAAVAVVLKYRRNIFAALKPSR